MNAPPELIDAAVERIRGLMERDYHRLQDIADWLNVSRSTAQGVASRRWELSTELATKVVEATGEPNPGPKTMLYRAIDDYVMFAPVMGEEAACERFAKAYGLDVEELRQKLLRDGLITPRDQVEWRRKYG